MTSDNTTQSDATDPEPTLHSDADADSGSGSPPDRNSESEPELKPDPQSPAEQPSTDTDIETKTKGDDENDPNRLTATKRKAMRYGVKSQNVANDNPTLARRFSLGVLVAILASIVFVNPVAAQCDEGAGLFIADMQEQIGAIVLGFIILIFVVSLALILLPIAGTAALGWTMMLAVAGGVILYMLAFWIFGTIGDYAVLGMDDACSPFF